MVSRVPKRPMSDLTKRSHDVLLTYASKFDAQSALDSEVVPQVVDNADAVEAQSSDDDDEDSDPTEHLGSSSQPRLGQSSHGTPPWAARLEGKVDQLIKDVKSLKGVVAHIREHRSGTNIQQEEPLDEADRFRQGYQRRSAPKSRSAPKRRNTARPASRH